MVTGDYAPEPLVFELGADGLTLRDAGGANDGARSMSITEAAAAAGGSASKGHSGAVGFG